METLKNLNKLPKDIKAEDLLPIGEQGMLRRALESVTFKTITQDGRNPNTPNFKRFRELVEKKFLDGLTEEESAEKEELDRAIDGFTAPFYLPILERLERYGKNRD